MKIIDLVQGSPEWHEFRRTHIGSSEAACIMGCAKYQPDTWLKLWRMKAGMAKETSQTPPMRRGIEREPITRKWVYEYTGIDVKPLVGVSGILSASFDGISEDRLTTVEIKNPISADGETWKAALNQEVEPHYFAQVQHQLLVSGAAQCLFVVDLGDERNDPIVIEVLPDLAYQTTLMDQCAAFWKHIEEFSPPEPTEKDIIPMTDDAWRSAVDTYRLAQKALKEAESASESARKSLIAMCEERSAACQGSGLRVQRVFRKGSVDYKKVPELLGVDLEPYRKEGSESWRIDEVKG